MNKTSNKKKKKTVKGGSHAIRNLWIIFGVFLTLVILFFVCVAAGIFGTMPSFEELENPQTNLATEIISADGKVLGTYYVENRSNVRYAELSPYMPEALISIEDERFTEHSGIDERALIRVAFGVLTGRKKGGGSTITQQLAKNLFPRGENLSTPKLVLRKFQEWITATKLEHNYSKEEIVAMYLNTVAFGHNAYGIRAAAKTFFDKSPKDLNIEECALMAGVVNAPTRFSPVRNPERSLGRRNLVLQKMADNGYITQAECDSISLIPLDMTHFGVMDHNSGQATYFREFLRGELTEWAKNILSECAMLCFVCPTASACGVITSRIGGDLQQGMAYLLLCDIMSTLLIPATVPLVCPQEGVGYFSLLWIVTKRVFSMLVLPCALAWLIRYTLPGVQKWLARYTGWAFYVWGISLMLAMSLATRALRQSDASIWMAAFIALVALSCCLLQFYLGRKLTEGYGRRVSVTAGQTLGQKNTGFLIWLGFNYMTPVTSVAGGLYAICQNLINSWELQHYRNNDGKES